jgi:hypothetical protein
MRLSSTLLQHQSHLEPVVLICRRADAFGGYCRFADLSCSACGASEIAIDGKQITGQENYANPMRLIF